MMFNRRIFSLTSPVRWQLIRTTLLGLSVIAAGAVQALLMARVLNLIFREESLTTVWPLIGGILVCMTLAAIFIWLHQLSAMATSAALKPVLRRRLYEHLLLLGPGYLGRTRTGTVQSTLVDAVEGLEAYIGYYIPQIFIALLSPAAILIFLFTIDVVAAAILLGALLVVMLGPTLYKQALGKRAGEHWDAWRGLNAQFLDSMQGMVTLKSFNASHRRGLELQKNAVGLYRAILAHMALSLVGTGITGLGMMVGTALVVGVSAVRLAQGILTPTELFNILFLSSLCLLPLVQLNQYWHEGFYGLAGARGIFGLLDTPAVIQDKVGGESKQLAQHPIRPTLTFDGVKFSYNDGERPAIANLSFQVASGETVALVGRSGAGKTTVVSLLLRFFDPQQGQILLDDRDLRSYPLDTVRALFAVVAQDTYLFHGSVRENLLLAKPNANQAELEAAAQAANAHDYIAALPNGYDTLIGERGLKLSGGERQRLAIARALLKDAPILILDEATSNVDAANEQAIQQALERLMVNRTTLIIAHRLSTVANADRIVVLEQGSAAEIGQHQDLLAQQGIYSRLVSAQQTG